MKALHHDTDNRLQTDVYIQDNQGNIRAVCCQDDDRIVQQTDYYPYGLPKATSTGAEANPFKYGGKELNTHLPQPFYDFVARMQLPQLCLFQRPDPKASDYTWLNPLTYCAADPINLVDPTGCRELPIDEVYNNQSWRHSNDFNVTVLNKRFHRGVDINIGPGDHDKGAPVYSTIKGKVVSINSYKDGNYGGNRVVIASEDGVVETKYMHLDTFSPGLTVGMDISEGQQIGTIGNTGRSKGPHLHYEIWVNNQPINPASGPNNLIDPQKLISIDNNDYRGILDEMVVYGIGNPHPQLKIQVIEPNLQSIERKSKLKL